MNAPFDTCVRVGGVGVGLSTSSDAFAGILAKRFAGFMEPAGEADYLFDVEVVEARDDASDEDVRVWREEGLWRIERGDFRAVLDPRTRRGRIRQHANPYSVDSLLRIVHTIALADEGGFLLHAASVVRGGRAQVFTGASGAGKTTLSRLAPPDTHVLTDEISYLRREDTGYVAYGTPFSGELGVPGANVSAPLAAIHLLAQGPENRVEDVAPAAAARAILGNVLFFAEDAMLVRRVFAAVLDAVERVPVRCLTFVPDESVWEVL
ncbi:MAG TPA: hypothetical protein VH301_14785 [Usitatibacter sp.]|nr:hypothetical protein [Usitatibacter sp.]